MRAEAFSDFIRQRGEVWSFDHFSLSEWLTRDDSEGNPRAGPYALDLKPARTRLADWGLAQFRGTC